MSLSFDTTKEDLDAFHHLGDGRKHSLQVASVVCLMAEAVSKHTRCVLSLQSGPLCLFTDWSLICVKEDQMLVKDDQMHPNGKT